MSNNKRIIINDDYLKNAKVSKTKLVNSKKYSQIVKDADKKIEDRRRKEPKILYDAKQFRTSPLKLEDTITYRLSMEDIVGNLFYTLKKGNVDVMEVSYKLIDKYAKIILEELNKVNINCWIDLSRDITNDFLEYNSDLYLDVKDDRNFSTGIALVSDLPINYFIEHYQGYLSLEILKVIIDDDVIKKVIDAYNEEIGVKKKILKNVK